MKNITRLSLALIMLSAFYFITTVHAQAPGSAAAGHMNQGGVNGVLNGGPAAQDMGGNMVNDGGHGANSAKESRAAKIKACVAEAVTAFTKETCKGLQ
jgi:hypothetical protein